MGQIKHRGDIEIEEDLDFQKKEWFFERLGWSVLLLIMLAAVLGLFGGGPLDKASAATPDQALRVDYARFGRFTASQTFEVELSPQARRDERAGLAFHNNFVDKLKIETTNPEPESVEVQGEWVVYYFRWPDGEAPLKVNVYVQPEKTGLLSAQLGLPGAASLQIRQFVYP